VIAESHKPALTMKYRNLINIDQILLNSEATSRKKAIEIISQLVNDSYPEYAANDIFESFICRERLGSTGIGHRVALPHGRIQNCIDPVGIFITLSEGIDFDAIDREPVNILFALLVPKDSTEEHLKILARLAEFFRQPENRNTLKNATSVESVYNILIKI
jgi:PTS system nitrogen regulatory IIA component